MLNFGTKNNANLHRLFRTAGFSVARHDGIWVTSDDAAVQAIIDKYNPLPDAQKDALQKVKDASASKRLEFVTQAAGKDAEYTFKAREATQFNIDGSIGVFMQARMDATGDTATIVADVWNANAAGWMQVGAYIAGLEDKATKLISEETDWTQCSKIADMIASQLKVI